MPHIFLSYASEDRERVRLLVRALEAEGFSVWWDRTIPPGTTWADIIEAELERADRVAVVWTRASVASKWVKTEASEGLERGILVPVLLDDVPPAQLPLAFKHLQAASLVHWAGEPDHPEFRQLCAAIRGERDGGGEGPPRVLGGRKKRAASERLPLLVGALAVALSALVASGIPRVWCEMLRWCVPHRKTVAVMRVDPKGPTEQWMCDVVQTKLETWLSKFSGLRVVIDQRQNEGQSDKDVAEALGIDSAIVGTVATMGERMMLDVKVVDVDAGWEIASSFEVTGTEAEFEVMHNRAAEHIIKALGIDIKSDEIEQLLALKPDAPNAKPDDYKLVLDMMGALDDGGDEEPTAPKPSGDRVGPTSWLPDLVPDAQAQDEPGAADPSASSDEDAVRALVEAYRAAIEAEDLDALSALHVDLSGRMRDAFVKYFANAEALKVQFESLEITVEEGEAIATFTRKDEFQDAGTGRPVRLEIRVSSILEYQEDGWKIRGLRRPS